MDYDVEFNTYGKIPSDSDYWKADIVFGDENGITPYFKKVIAEQVFAPNKSPTLRFYEKFAGRPLAAGDGFTERVLKKDKNTKHFKPKADANDALGFYDSGGYEFTHKVDYEGWIPVTLPSELESLSEMLKPESVGQLNSILVDNVKKRYDINMESAVAKKLVSSIKSEATITYKTAADLITAIKNYVTEFRGNKVHYNNLENVLDPGGTEYYNDNIYTNSEMIYVFIDEKIWNWITANKASLPSPDFLNIEGAEIVTLPDGCPTPITAAEFAAGVTAQGWDAEYEPEAMGEDQPDIIICSSRIMEVRPVAGTYKVNLAKNAAGDFENQHLLWKCALAYRREENALRCYLSFDESPEEVTIANTEENPVPTQEVSP